MSRLCIARVKQVLQMGRKATVTGSWKHHGVWADTDGLDHAGPSQAWQQRSRLSNEVKYVGPMIIEDARRILELRQQINALNEDMKTLVDQSEIARRISTIPGFGKS